MAEERTPAGWYPDPSGLPQLRWWDNHKWTEFVSDSQVEQDSRREDDSRREQDSRRGAHAAAYSSATSAAEHGAAGYAAEHSAAAHIAAQAAEPQAAEPIAAEPIAAEPIRAEPAARYDAGPRVDPSTAPDLRSAFDAMFTEPAAAEAPPAGRPHSTEPSLVDAFDQTFGYATPGVPDPAEAMFAASATSPIGVGTGETIGEALMRALQSA